MSDADIHSIRRSLGLGEREEALIRDVASLLAPEVPIWVERFYARLVVDPVAMRLLTDEARIVRLKRSLEAWFHELLSLPFDDAHARARARIGHAHVRIGMPQHLMVTAMGGLQRDVADAVERVLGRDPERRSRVVRALGMALDLELALMLGAYRRRSDEVARRADAGLHAQLAAWRTARRAVNALDAARCYAALLKRSADEAERTLWGSRLDEALEETARADRAEAVTPSAPLEEARETAVEDLCAGALAAVDLRPGAHAETVVVPPGLRSVLRAVPVGLGLVEMIRDVAARGEAGALCVRAHGESGAVAMEVLGPRSARPNGKEAADGGGTSFAWATFAAEVHGGTLEAVETADASGWRLRLRCGPPRDEDAHRARDPGRSTA